MSTIERLSTALADRYTIERELGAGGMATVYLAEDLKHHRKVAIKVLRPELAAVIGAERFLSEIKTTANLQHPNILALFDSGVADGQAYYVMHQALQKLPADRFASAKEFAEALRIGGMTSEQTGIGIARVRVAPAATIRWRRWLVPVVLAGVALGLGGYALGRRGTSANDLPRQWRGELLGGPDVAIYPMVSHNGQMVAFQAFVDGQTQLAVLTPASGAWRVLTTNRSQGLVNAFSWSRDDSRIYYDRLLGGPNGVYSISPLGTDDRLVLANAGLPDVLPDGSLLAARLNIDRNGQMYHFWPESGRLDTLGAVAANTNTEFFRSFPDGKEAAFFGRPTDQKGPRTHLYAIDLTTKHVRMLAPDSNFGVASISVTPDNKWVVISSPMGAMQRIIAVARDGSDRTETLASLTSPSWMVDVGSDGSLYFDQYSMPRQLVHFTPGSGATAFQSMPPTALGATSVLPLPDGRTLLAVVAGNNPRVMTIAPGTDATPFLGSTERSDGPLALLGDDRVLLRVGDSVAIASLATGQLLRRVIGMNPVSLAGSPDGKTIYYTAARTVWAMPSGGGPARKVRDGDAVAPDPHGKYLVVEVDDTDRVRLFHVPLDGTGEQEIPVHGEVRLAAGVYLTSNAVGPDGRIIVEVAPPSSWFWPVAILDPRSGALAMLPPGPSYDMKGGWSPDGRAVYEIRAQQSMLWRFQPVTRAGATP